MKIIFSYGEFLFFFNFFFFYLKICPLCFLNPYFSLLFLFHSYFYIHLFIMDYFLLLVEYPKILQLFSI
jgi:hypothetical protein